MNKKGILWPSILALVGFILFAVILITLFLVPLIVVGANIIILYFFFLRIYTEITKYKRGDIYAYSFIAAALIVVIFKNFLPLWWITTVTILAFIIAQIYIMMKKR
ncbi:MAG: hypothetical protein QW165_00905 [Candidatus Woesearchaeota archaeon]